MKRAIHVVGAAIIREGRVLCAKRSSTMALPNKWEFPGGKVEDGESPQEALRREIREELGVDVEVGAFLACGHHEQPAVVVTLDVYHARYLTGEWVAREHSELRWVGRAQLPTLDWAEADLPAVEALLGILP